MVPELNRILLSGPENVDATEDTLWEEKWGQVQWGTQRELDEADKVAFGTALQQSKGSGKGVSYKGNRHWSAPMVHSSYYAPFPFEFHIVEVEHIAFSWDEYCTKCGATQHTVGDVAVCTYQGKPVAPEPDATMAEGETTTQGDPRSQAVAPTKGAKGSGKPGRGS